MALSYTSAEQNDIAYRIHDRPYSELKPDQQNAIDGGSTSASSGHAKDALDLVRRWSSFVDPTAGADAAPDAARRWFVDEVVYAASRRLDPELVGRHREARNDSRAAFFETYTRSDWDETSTTEGLVVNHANLRRHVLSACVRQQRPVLPAPEDIDAAVRASITGVWNKAVWSWRRQPVQIGVATDTTVTVTPSVAIKGVLHDRLIYLGSTAGTTGGTLRVVGDDDIGIEIAKGYPAGKPLSVSLNLAGGDLQWLFDRTPDQAYTLRAVAILECPALASSANIDTALGRIPTDLHPLIQDLAVARVLSKYGAPGSAGMLRTVMEEISDTAHKVSDVGSDGMLGLAHERRDAISTFGYRSDDGGVFFGGGL